jgi:hypothetical protein
MTGDDETDSNTQVPIIICVWVLVAMLCRARPQMSPLPEVPTPMVLTRY